jgi:hypothetical protein
MICETPMMIALDSLEGGDLPRGIEPLLVLGALLMRYAVVPSPSTPFLFRTHHNLFGKARFPRRQRSEAQLPHTAWPHTLCVSTHLRPGQLVHI